MCQIIEEFVFCANVENCVNPIKEQVERYMKAAEKLKQVHAQLSQES